MVLHFSAVFIYRYLIRGEASAPFAHPALRTVSAEGPVQPLNRPQIVTTQPKSAPLQWSPPGSLPRCSLFTALG